jgi:hypothetical protein
MSSEFVRRFNSSTTALEIAKGVDLKWRTIGITGTTNGIGNTFFTIKQPYCTGIETARTLALANGHIVMFCRNTTSAEELKAKTCAEKVCSYITLL